MQTILPSKRLDISFMDLKKSETTLEQVIQAYFIDLYYMKLRWIIRTSLPINGINTCHFISLSIDIKDCIWISSANGYKRYIWLNSYKWSLLSKNRQSYHLELLLAGIEKDG